MPEGAPPPGAPPEERERPPLVPPEERARRAGERAKELIEGKQPPPDVGGLKVPPPKGDAETDDLIERIGKELRSRERTVGPSQPPDIPKPGEKIKTTTQKNPDGSTTRTYPDGTRITTHTYPDGSWVDFGR